MKRSWNPLKTLQHIYLNARTISTYLTDVTAAAMKLFNSQSTGKHNEIWIRKKEKGIHKPTSSQAFPPHLLISSPPKDRPDPTQDRNSRLQIPYLTETKEKEKEKGNHLT